MALVTCRECGKESSDQASTCPHCGRPLRTAQMAPAMAPVRAAVKRKTFRATWGCLVLVAMSVVLIGIVEKAHTSGTQNHPAGSQPEWKTNPKTGQRYLAMPSYPVSGTTETKPWLHVRALLAVGSSGIKSELLKQLGPDARPRFDKADTTWEAKTAEGSVSVVTFKGRIVSVVIYFTAPVRDWGAALAAIDLQPCTTPPTMDAIGASTWTKAFVGIDEVSAVHKPVGKPPVEFIIVIPDKRLADEAARS